MAAILCWVVIHRSDTDLTYVKCRAGQHLTAFHAPLLFINVMIREQTYDYFHFAGQEMILCKNKWSVLSLCAQDSGRPKKVSNTNIMPILKISKQSKNVSTHTAPDAGGEQYLMNTCYVTQASRRILHR